MLAGLVKRMVSGLRLGYQMRFFAGEPEKDILSCKDAATKLSKMLLVEHGHEQGYLKDVALPPVFTSQRYFRKN